MAGAQQIGGINEYRNSSVLAMRKIVCDQVGIGGQAWLYFVSMCHWKLGESDQTQTIFRSSVAPATNS